MCATQRLGYCLIAAAGLAASASCVNALAVTPPAIIEGTVQARDNSDSSQWTTRVEIGTKKWHIGDAVSQDFEAKFMKAVCDGNGCDSGNPQTFKYLTPYGSYTALGTGTITMEGNADNSTTVIDKLLDVVSTTLVKSSQCTTKKTQRCANNPGPSDTSSQWTSSKKRESGSVALDCGEITFNSCTLANYVQATMYDADKSQKAQVTFRGESEDPSDLDCSSVVGGINDALGAMSPLELPGVDEISGLISLIADLVCPS